MNRSSFRFLVVAFAVLIVGSIVVELATESMLPEPLKSYVAAEFEGDLTAKERVLLAAFFPLLFAVMATLVGLFFLQNWARWLFLVTTVLSILLTPFAGPYVNSGLTEAVDALMYLLNGVILVLAFCSSLSREFGRDENSKLPPPLP